jgi:hypothetical protein
MVSSHSLSANHLIALSTMSAIFLFANTLVTKKQDNRLSGSTFYLLKKKWFLVMFLSCLVLV